MLSKKKKRISKKIFIKKNIKKIKKTIFKRLNKKKESILLEKFKLENNT